jgi:hypothetical protein
MLKNIGAPDRVIRILIAVAVAVLYFTGVISGTTGIILLVLGAVLFITAVVGVCPLYMLFGLRTTKAEK